MMLVWLLIFKFVVVTNCIQCYTFKTQSETQIEGCHQCSTTIIRAVNAKSWQYFSKKCWIEPCNDFVHVSFGYIYQMKCCNTTLCNNDRLFINFNPRYLNNPTTTTTIPSNGSSVFSQLTISLMNSSISPMSSPSPTTNTSSIEGFNNVLYIIISIAALLIIIFPAILIAMIIIFARKRISRSTCSLPTEESQNVHSGQMVISLLPLQTQHISPESNDTNPMSYL